MILDSLVNHIPRALNIVCFWVAGGLEGWPTYEHKHSLSPWFLDSRQNALKIIESPFTGIKIKTKRRNFSFRLQFNFYQLNC